MKVEPYVTDDGSVTYRDVERDVTFRSRHGARTESLHVFVEGCLERTPQLDEYRVLELGFGAGMNFALTYEACAARGTKLHYCAVERDPVRAPLPVGPPAASDLAARALSEPGSTVADCVCELVIHPCDWSSPLRAPGDFDAVYHDPFAPSVDPSCWTQECFAWSAALAAPHGVLATYSSAGHVRRALAAAGWHPRTARGPGRKREITYATLSP